MVCNSVFHQSSRVAEKMLSTVDTLGHAMAKRVASGTNLEPVVKPNLGMIFFILNLIT